MFKYYLDLEFLDVFIMSLCTLYLYYKDMSMEHEQLWSRIVRMLPDHLQTQEPE